MFLISKDFLIYKNVMSECGNEIVIIPEETNMKWAIFVKAVILIVFIIAVYMYGNVNSSFFHIGPSNDKVTVDVFGINVTTWKTWWIVMIFLFVIELSNAWSGRRFKRWTALHVHGTESRKCNLSRKGKLSCIGIWKCLDFTFGMLKWFLAISNKQFQFLLVPYLGSLLADLYIDNECIQQLEGNKSCE